MCFLCAPSYVLRVSYVHLRTYFVFPLCTFVRTLCGYLTIVFNHKGTHRHVDPGISTTLINPFSLLYNLLNQVAPSERGATALRI